MWPWQNVRFDDLKCILGAPIAKWIYVTNRFFYITTNRCNLKYNAEKGKEEGECIAVGKCQRDNDCVISSYPHCDIYIGQSTGICTKLECRENQDCKVCNLISCAACYFIRIKFLIYQIEKLILLHKFSFVG